MTRTALIVLLSLVLVTTGCRSLTGRSAGQWVDDQTLTAKVKSRLAGLRAHTLTRVNVDTYDGIVYLSGTVDSPEMKSKMEAAARDIDRVRQVVPNLQVLNGTASFRPGDVAVAASPLTAPPRDAVATISPTSLRARIPGVARVESGQGNGHGPFQAYDAAGRRVATVYTISMRELARAGLEELRGDGRPIDHVSIYSVPAHPDVPDAHYHVVLWHVSPREASALR